MGSGCVVTSSHFALGPLEVNSGHSTRRGVTRQPSARVTSFHLQATVGCCRTCTPTLPSAHAEYVEQSLPRSRL